MDLFPTGIPSSSIRRGLARIGLVLVTPMFANLSVGQSLFALTERGWPGGTLAARGDLLDLKARFSVRPYSRAGAKLPAISLTPTSANGQVALIDLPSSLTYGVYEVLATTSKGKTGSLWVNRPRVQWLDATEALPGQSVRIIGRNLHPLASAATIVSLVSGMGTRVSTAVTETGDDCVVFRVPVGLSGRYRVTLNNGLAGTASSIDGPLLNVVRGADPFGLGVSWGREFARAAANVINVKTDPRMRIHATGNGVTDDSAAFRDAVRVADGGGTIYAPAGTYLVDDGQKIPLYAGRVLRGAGKGKTIFKVGYRYSATVGSQGTNYYPIVLWGDEHALAGLCDCTVQNVSKIPAPTGVLGFNSPYAHIYKSFIRNVEFQMGNGLAITLAHPREFVWSDCTVDSTHTYVQPIRVTDAWDLHFLRNVVRYNNGRVTLDYGQRNVIEGNRITFDNAHRTPESPETGGVELNYGHDILVKGNTVGGTGSPAKKAHNTDGELLMSQYGTMFEFSYVGMVRAASGRTLVPMETWGTTKWFGDAPSDLPRMIVAVIAGKGMGQWRWVTAQTTKSLTIDHSWDVVPNTTSRYSISSATAFGQTDVGNTLFGSTVALSFWDGAIDCDVLANTVTNSGAILLRGDSIPASRVRGRPESNVLFNFCWDVSVRENSITDSNGSVAAAVSVVSQDEAYANYGTMILGVVLSGNRIAGSGFRSGDFFSPRDGIQVLDDFHNTAENGIADIGMIIENNTLRNTAGVYSAAALPRIRATGNRSLPARRD